MDFEMTYTPEQQAFRDHVREWFTENLPPELKTRVKTADASRSAYEARRAFGRKLGEKGWLYASAPTRYGGGGLGADEVIVLLEESAKFELRLPPYYDAGGRLGAASILVWGTEEQKAEFLPPIYTGQVRTWQLLSEPSAGSDLAGVRTTAIKDGDDYILNGQKTFIGSAHGCDRMWTLTMTGRAEDRHENLGWFMIDANLPGITVQPMDLLSNVGEGEGDVGHKNMIFLDNVRVPARALIGGENNGWRVAQTHLELEHGMGFPQIAGDPLWERLLGYCQSEKIGSRRLVDDPAVRETLCDVHIADHINRLLGIRNFWLGYARRPMSYEGSQVAYMRKTSALWKSGAILRALGPRALTNDEVWGAADGALESHQRESIVGMHPGGTADVQRVIMARRIGIGREEREQAGHFEA